MLISGLGVNMEGKYKHYLDIVSKHIAEIFSECNTMLAGGSCLSVIQNSVGITSTYNDLDFYFETEEEYQIAYKKLQEEKEKTESMRGFFSYEHETEFAYTTVINGQEFQLIKIFKPFEKTIAEFDIKNSKCWSFYPFDVVQTDIDTETLTTKLQIESATKNIGTIARILKYNSRKSLDISNCYDSIFDTLSNHTTADYSTISYASEIEDRNNFVAHLIYSALGVPGFLEYLEEKENLDQPEILPFYLLEGVLLEGTLLQSSRLKSLAFYQKNPSDEIKDWMVNNFPERVL